MKQFLLIFFSVLSFAMLSQGGRTEKIKITKSHFNKIKTINELLPSLPKECEILGYQFAIDLPESKRSIKIKNNEISSDLKSIIKDMRPGQEFFIESIRSDCKTSFKKSHIFIITA